MKKERGRLTGPLGNNALKRRINSQEEYARQREIKRRREAKKGTLKERKELFIAWEYLMKPKRGNISKFSL